MPQYIKMEGTCLCGEIKVTIPSGLKVGVCHCIDCRHAYGGTHGAIFDMKRRDMQLTGEPKVYAKIGNSGHEVRRYFCGNCGSPIYVDGDVNAIKGETGYTEESPVYVKIGLFPAGSIPRPSSYQFTRDMEEWEKPVDGAQVKETQ